MGRNDGNELRAAPQDMCKKRFAYVRELKVLVLDEADVMLDQDAEPAISTILACFSYYFYCWYHYYINIIAIIMIII